MLPSRRIAVLVGTALCCAAFAGCSSGSKASTAAASKAGTGHTLTVPGQYKTIQAAVDAAKSGDLVLVSPGVYKEAVDVSTDKLTIRGSNRNTVILDGGYKLTNGVRVLGANGVSVENMTARSYVSNGFYWTGVDGYRGSYLTAYNNGDYGIYSFDSNNGLFEYSYGSGSPDAGFYVGGCNPCNVLLNHVVSEFNGLGYSGTNSGGNLVIANSTFRNNRAGIVPNTGSYEKCYPERGDIIVGNLVHDNNYDTGPAIDNARLAQENGILVAGGWDNQVLRNRVYNHHLTGIALVPFPETNASDIEPKVPASTCAEQSKLAKTPKSKIPATVLWSSYHNVVKGNIVSGSGLADLGAFDQDDSRKNCFAKNEFTSSAPDGIEALEPCSGSGSGDFTKNPLDVTKLVARETPLSGNYKVQPVPGPQAQMPDAATAPTRQAGAPPKLDIAAIEVPAAPKA